jgi:hypothetical protein
VATVFVTKPLIHAGLIEHDKETVILAIGFRCLCRLAIPPSVVNGPVVSSPPSPAPLHLCAFALKQFPGARPKPVPNRAKRCQKVPKSVIGPDRTIWWSATPAQMETTLRIIFSLTPALKVAAAVCVWSKAPGDFQRFSLHRVRRLLESHRNFSTHSVAFCFNQTANTL